MSKELMSVPLRRRAILKAGLAIGALQVASPFVVKSLADEPVKIGLDNPLTGTFAALGKNELLGAQLAVEQMNAKGGILGRQVQLLVEDSTSGEAAVAVQKANKLIERDQVNFLLGNINSALAQAMANVSFEKKVFHIVPGGHTDSVTGSQCHWNVFRVCNTTRMETNSVSKVLIDSYGKKWYFITTDYAFGRTLQQGFEASLKAVNGTELGADYTPLGTTDFSANLIKAQSTNPDAIILLLAGDDMVNCLKQAVQFGLDKKTHIAGAQQELEAAERSFREGVCRRRPQEERRPRADRAHLVRLCRCSHLQAGGGKGEVARCHGARQSDAGSGPAAGGRIDAERSILPDRRQPADADIVRRKIPTGTGGRRSGRSRQGHATGQGRPGRVAGRSDRLQDGLAELIQN